MSEHLPDLWERLLENIKNYVKIRTKNGKKFKKSIENCEIMFKTIVGNHQNPEKKLSKIGTKCKK